MKTRLFAMLSAFAVSAFAGNEANPDAIELAPLPAPAEFRIDMDRPVAFDASTTVALECPDDKGTEWLAVHFREWYGAQSPKVVASNLSTFQPPGSLKA